VDEFYIKRGDQGPVLDATLQTPTGEPIDLSSADAVVFKMASIVDAPADIVSATAGTVRYLWELADTRRAGDFNAEFEIEWADGRKQTVPNDGYITIHIERDLS
jgi:hypothetical protein